MSLINDALRKASQSQKQRPPESSPEHQLGALLQPVDYQRRSNRWMLLLAVPVVAALLVLAGWFFLKARGTAPQTQPAATRTATVTPANTASASQPAAAPVQPPEPAKSSAPVSSAPLPVAKTNFVTQTNFVTITNLVAQTNPIAPPTTVAQTPEVPKAPAVTPSAAEPTPTVATAKNGAPQETKTFPRLTLQGISYQPVNPFAVINGKKLYVGGRIDDVKVVTIDRQTVTVEWEGQTKTLNMQ